MERKCVPVFMLGYFFCVSASLFYVSIISVTRMRLIFACPRQEFLEAIRRETGSSQFVSSPLLAAVQIEETSDVRCAERMRSSATETMAYISPANSLGFMDGGIDRVYSREMFPGVEAALKRRIKEVGAQTFLGRPYLPIGSAICLSVRRSVSEFLVSAPTMFLPHDVSRTHNAYHAFLAALTATEKRRINILVCPALCCGYGKMSSGESASQIMRALYDFVVHQKRTRDIHPDEDVVFAENHADIENEQPNNFDNREIKTFRVTDIVR